MAKLTNQTAINYHIHIDATVMPDALAEYGTRVLNLDPTDFFGHPEGYRHFEPRRHLTGRIRTAQEFGQVWSALEKKAEATGFIGYLEGEWIMSDEVIPFKEYRDVPVPFRIDRRRLREEEKFRQTEFHLVMDKDRSHPQLIKGLLEAGLYGAYMEKRGHSAVVLTAQGFISDIDPLVERLHGYLLEVGGAVNCSLKEERAIRHRLFGILPVDLPEIVENIVHK